MPIDRELLKKAWPEGFLAVRGVSTVGGLQCVRTSTECDYANPVGHSWWLGKIVFHGDDPSKVQPVLRSDELRFDSRRVSGDLLPNVDPDDAATWACLLADLARALGHKHPRRLHWAKERAVQIRGAPSEPDVDGIIQQVLSTVPLPAPNWTLDCGTCRSCEEDEDEEDEEGPHIGFSFGFLLDIDTSDPAEALVLARIQVREERGL